MLRSFVSNQLTNGTKLLVLQLFLFQVSKLRPIFSNELTNQVHLLLLLRGLFMLRKIVSVAEQLTNQANFLVQFLRRMQ